MNNPIWKSVATACYFLVLFVHVIGGMFLTVVVPGLFGLNFDDLPSLTMAQIFRLPIILSLLAIWLPLLIGLAWAMRLLRSACYGASILVSLLTPFVSLLLLILAVMLVLLPLGR